MSTLVACLAGLAVGRLLSVVVQAVPAGERVWQELGRRPSCGCRAVKADLAPVLWWLRNRGRCRHCDRPVDVTYPFVELLTAAAFSGTAHLVGVAWSLPAYLWFVSVTLALGLVDLRHRRIPNRILGPGVVVGTLLLSGGAALDGRIRELPEALGAGAGYFLVLLVPALLTAGAIGMGDVKLAFFLGLFVGYGQWEAAVLAGIGAFVLAGVVVIVLLVFRVLGRSDHVPFGPFMVGAAWIAIAADLGG